jgi:hypothetical protein
MTGVEASAETSYIRQNSPIVDIYLFIYLFTYLLIYLLPASCSFLTWLIFRSWRWRLCVPLEIDSNSPGCKVLYTLHSHCCENVKSSEWNGSGWTRSLPILRHLPVISWREQPQVRQLVLGRDSNLQPEYKSEALPLEPSCTMRLMWKQKGSVNIFIGTMRAWIPECGQSRNAIYSIWGISVTVYVQ